MTGYEGTTRTSFLRWAGSISSTVHVPPLTVHKMAIANRRRLRKCLTIKRSLGCETGIELFGGDASSPSAWECDGGREGVQVFVLGVETGVFKGR